MTTLITVRGRYRRTHRCDAHCYEAKSDPVKCECICAGKNHGVGADRATQNVRAFTPAQLRDIAARGGWIADNIRQGELL